jgi:hypothetical protein
LAGSHKLVPRCSGRAAHFTPGISIQNVIQDVSALNSGGSRTETGGGPTVRFTHNAPRCNLKEDPMNTSIKTRAAALVAAIAVTFGTIDLIADYAHPAAPTVLLASTAR